MGSYGSGRVSLCYVRYGFQCGRNRDTCTYVYTHRSTWMTWYACARGTKLEIRICIHSHWEALLSNGDRDGSSIEESLVILHKLSKVSRSVKG